ncbi:uncharacterized protein LOC122196174 isoform X2 [Lactuca sativa]|uniref:uncharacterized protein LOC122196174 isoform X2 n=1 Tax=Lactuca sativa TaxID=4236 RepID=UPI0022B0283A|nr:uncharacterized protein LOC122196174 isoform X2 [Lactuca sativa]
MSSRLQNPFFGAAFQSSLKPRNVNCLGYLGNKFPRKPRYDIIPRAKKNDWISHGIRFSQSFGENVEILWKNMGLRSGFVVKSVKEPYTRSKAIVRSLSTVWEEGLLLFQCSVFYAVISGVCLLLWYSQLKANTLIESKLFPSVCATLSDYIQCDLHFCKAQSVSPLSITLESCWIRPHKEEFSFVVYNRTLLAVQKRKYLWLGIPFTDGVLQKHLSTEEGIDNRTKIRRNAREQTVAQSNIRLEDAFRNSKDSHLKDFTSTNPYTTTEASVNKSSPEIPSSSNNSNHNVQQGDGSIYRGALLGTYEDNRFKSESKKPYLKSIGSLNLGGGPELEKKLKYTEHVCSGVILGKELVNAPPNVLTPGVSAEEAEKIASTIDCDKLSDIGSEYEGFWIDTADKQPCIGMGGMIPWKLHVTGKLFHSGLAHKGDSLLIILKSFIEKQSAQSTRKLSLCQQQSIHNYFLITLVTALLFMHKAEHILYQHTSLKTFMIV